MQQDIQELAARFLLAMKTQTDATDLVNTFALVSLAQLKNDLPNDREKKAFWINAYNAFYLYLRQQKGLQKPAIYRDKVMAFKDFYLSLDDIEHGILRKNRWKFSLGYLANPFASKTLKQLAVKQLDYRIHFALNCGAKSCPPIAFYKAAHITSQLEMATLSFLESETIVKEDLKEIHLTALFKWFSGDFGGKPGIRSILAQQLQIDTKGFKLVFKPYDWTEDLGNFIS